MVHPDNLSYRPPMISGPIHALLLAGNRPERGWWGDAFGVSAKALAPIDGEAMLSRVTRALAAHPRIGRVTILAQDVEALAADPSSRWMRDDPSIGFEKGVDSISDSVAAAIARRPGDYPFLVTTADHPLIDAAMIDAFLDRANSADVVVAFVERRILSAAYPGNRRTWLKFRGGAYSGANIFLFAGPRANAALELWRSVEAKRKRGRAVIGAFGPILLSAVGLRLLTLESAFRAAGKRLGITAQAVELPMAEACIDVDTLADHAMGELILKERNRPSGS